VSVTAQRRDRDQTELTIDYLVQAAPPRTRSTVAWCLGIIAAATVLSALMMRPLRSLSAK
jgi:hypothetical protein